MEDRRKRRVAFGESAMKMLRFLEDSEDLKVGISELKEQMETPEDAGFSIMEIAQQARNVQGQNSEFFGKERKRCALPVWQDGTRN